jgi:hypothetical protein
MRGTWQVIDPGSKGGGGGAIVVITLALLFAGSGAAAGLARALAELLIALAVVLVLTIAAGITFLVYRARQDRPAITCHTQQVPGIRQQLADLRPPAIAPPASRELHLHLHELTEDQITAITRMIRNDAEGVE